MFFLYVKVFFLRSQSTLKEAQTNPLSLPWKHLLHRLKVLLLSKLRLLQVLVTLKKTSLRDVEDDAHEQLLGQTQIRTGAGKFLSLKSYLRIFSCYRFSISRMSVANSETLDDADMEYSDGEAIGSEEDEVNYFQPNSAVANSSITNLLC
jgi:hypothetical protein